MKLYCKASNLVRLLNIFPYNCADMDKVKQKLDVVTFKASSLIYDTYPPALTAAKEVETCYEFACNDVFVKVLVEYAAELEHHLKKINKAFQVQKNNKYMKDFYEINAKLDLDHKEVLTLLLEDLERLSKRLDFGLDKRIIVSDYKEHLRGLNGNNTIWAKSGK